MPVLSDIPGHVEFLGKDLSKILCVERDETAVAAKLNELHEDSRRLSGEVQIRVQSLKWAHIAKEIFKVYIKL